MTESGRSGSRVVLALYLVLVGVGGVGGFIVGLTIEGLRAPAFLFLVELPPTPAGMALYGASTVAVALGVPLLAVVLVSRRLEDAAQ